MDATKIHKYNIKSSPFFFEPVEIIIPFHGEQTRVTRLMENIFATVLGNRYLITLVDDGSENRNFVFQIDKARMPGVRCFRREKAQGFGSAINAALSRPKHNWIRWVLVMHSDVYPEDNLWLNNLGECLMRMKASGVKMVSPKTNKSMACEEVLEGVRGEPAEDAVLNGQQFLPMYCALFHRELFKRVGPFKEFPYAGCEVEEYAMRMRAAGYKQAVCGNSWIHHEGGATLSRLADNAKVQEILRKAREEFEAGRKSDQKETPKGVHKDEVKDTPFKEDSHHEMQKK